MHVLTAGPGDALDGIIIDAAVGGGGARFVDAPQIAGFYERGVRLALDGEACAALPRPQPPPAGPERAGARTPMEAKLRRAWEVLAGGPGA